MNPGRTERIRILNDAMRTTLHGGRILVTAGVQALGQAGMAQVLARVQSFADFTRDNDPHGEHDFGNFDECGARIYFKIDYYDGQMEHGSEDPSDPTKTTRVLTIMLASEY